MRTGSQITADVKGKTVISTFAEMLEDHADQVALRWMEGEDWGQLTYGELADTALRLAAALRDIGVAPGDRVVMMIRNVWQFHAADLAIMMCGATPVSIYNSSSPEQVDYLAGHCEAKAAIVENKAFADRFADRADALPKLENVIGIDPGTGADLDWDDLVTHDPMGMDEAIASLEPSTLATIIYTSGTTGNPKGVMLDHENICWTVECLRDSFQVDGHMAEMVGKKVVSYLPMAHIAERATSHYGCTMLGYEVSCCPDPSQIATYAREVRPNVMFGVPRVWEKIYAGINAALAADPEKAEKVAEAVESARPIVAKMAWGEASQEDIDTWNFLDAVAFSTIRDLVGLDQLDIAVTGAAPITPDMFTWFRAIGVPIAEIYGMSESSGPMTFAAYKVKAGSVGPAAAGIEVKIADDGEVVCRGGNVFRGYLNDPEKTAEALDADGWLHSGDIGEMDEDGYVRIVDRKKELIITAGGKNISPANLEAALKSIPLVGQACAIGDQRPFVSALVVLDAEVAPAWAAQNGLEGMSLAELAEHPDVVAEIDAGLVEVMESFNNAERVKKVKILADEWMPDSELLTPTSKLKRRGIHATFEGQIESLYG